MRYMIALGLLLGTFSCKLLAPNPTLTGVVSYVYVLPPGYNSSYPGHIQVDSTAVGPISVHISYRMSIRIRSSNTNGDITSFALGDRVIMHYDDDQPILLSYPPFYPVTSIEIEK